MKYSIVLPNGWKMSLVGIKDPVEAYEAMTNVVKAADETGYEAIWLVDHFHTVPHPPQEMTLHSARICNLHLIGT
jgi:alkanesulfonate monooxygenase SsuD/methylene tetrahydromethanopterin reductase-like flavin-dependent oxidoreductase (luciferase family)